MNSMYITIAGAVFGAIFVVWGAIWQYNERKEDAKKAVDQFNALREQNKGLQDQNQKLSDKLEAKTQELINYATGSKLVPSLKALSNPPYNTVVRFYLENVDSLAMFDVSFSITTNWDIARLDAGQQRIDRFAATKSSGPRTLFSGQNALMLTVEVPDDDLLDNFFGYYAVQWRYGHFKGELSGRKTDDPGFKEIIIKETYRETR